MYASTIALALAATATVASAGNVYVDNKCANSIYLESFQNANAPVFQTELFAGATPGYIEIQRGATGRPAGNNTIVIGLDERLPNPLEFSYSINSDDGIVYYSFVSVIGNGFEQLGYEVLTDGGHDPVTCVPPQGGGGDGVCANARNRDEDNGPVFNVPISSQPNGPNFTVRLCASDGAN